jgi:hypothetical protein
MPTLLAIAVACTVLALLPVLAGRKRVLANPATFVFLSIVWGVLLKALYVAFVRTEPHSIVHDQIYVAAASMDELVVGGLLVLIAVAAYVAGYFAFGRRSPAMADLLPSGVRARWAVRSPGGSSWPNRIMAVGLATVCLAAFAAYLYLSGVDILQPPFSAKRFGANLTTVQSRFQYAPYYFFKVAMLSGPLAYAVAHLLTQAVTRAVRRFFKVLFALVFGFALLLCHFASLRLVILVVLLQTVLLLYHARARELAPFMAAFVALTAASFAAITFGHRAAEDVEVVRAEMLAARAAQAAVERAASRRAPARGDAPRAVIEPANPQVRGARAAGDDGPAPGSRPAAAAESSGDATGAGGAPAGERPTASAAQSVVQRVGRLAAGPFEGRYFLDFTKLAHIANHFPERQPHLWGGGLVGVLRPSFSAAAGPDIGALTLDRYLAIQVFEEPLNSVPAGFAGDLYIDFGFAGLFLGFLALGAFHRWILNRVAQGSGNAFAGACLVILIPNTSIVLLNSGTLPSLSRSILEISVLALVCLPFVLRRGGDDPDQQLR